MGFDRREEVREEEVNVKECTVDRRIASLDFLGWAAKVRGRNEKSLKRCISANGRDLINE
jgi:hypothetical protein